MARRSTRNKIQWQAGKIQDQLDRCLLHLKAIDEMGEGKSEVINTWVPHLVSTFDSVKTLIETFQGDL